MNSPQALESEDWLIDAYRSMLRIRKFEERVAELIESGEVGTPCHLYIGQEAVAVGVASSLEREDFVWGGHRSHGHYLAKGGDLKGMTAEILGKSTGCSGGRGGSMHVFDKSVGILGTVPIVAATIPLAVGSALASKLRGDTQVSVCFFGDGAMEEGHFFESLNLATIYGLPVVFVCENNFYSSHLALEQRRASDNLVQLAAPHGVDSVSVDGNDVVEVARASERAVNRARSGGGSSFIECRTYRWRGHVGPSWDMDVGVQRKDELKSWMDKDPIKLVRSRLVELGVTEPDIFEAETAVAAEIDEALRWARESPAPQSDSGSLNVFVERARG